MTTLPRYASVFLLTIILTPACNMLEELPQPDLNPWAGLYRSPAADPASESRTTHLRIAQMGMVLTGTLTLERAGFDERRNTVPKAYPFEAHIIGDQAEGTIEIDRVTYPITLRSDGSSLQLRSNVIEMENLLVKTAW